jgi:hypothetical protein
MLGDRLGADGGRVDAAFARDALHRRGRVPRTSSPHKDDSPVKSNEVVPFVADTVGVP